MLGKIVDFVKKKPGLTILIFILSWITLANIKPDFYLMGWDNYSSYFNLKTNIFRTFFATWREYRGLGVPSDSESTDIFRQLFFLILSPFLKQELLDQIFSLFSFNLGVILIYLLSKKLFKNTFKENEQKLDLLGTFASLFYIFNLNTLATFYFPMIMYINRFYTVPLLFYIFFSLIKDKITLKKIVFFSFLIIFSSGAYLTATVFITVVISLTIFLLIQSQSIKKTFILLLYFIFINSFWLFPFINYTINKSGIVYQAPTFIDANEIQLNKPSSFYSLSKQLILYPNFFDNTINSFNIKQIIKIHPLGNFFDKFPYNFVLSLFPLFYIAGAILIIFKFKTHKKLLWIPLLIFLYLFLSLKVFSPLGFIYIFLEKKIPYFGSLFRFGDTKFHYFISFAGSLSAGFFLIKISEKLNKRNIILLLSTLITSLILVFSNYFNGHFFGFFELNKLPKAYFEIAKIINSDQEEFRVLHLPFNQDRYWRSYNWGYLGSAFFHFLINKPLLEKTFEPASQENVELNQEIYEMIEKKRIDELYYLLKKTGVKYIIFDETISANIPTKGLGGWGKYNYFESKEAINQLESKELIKKVNSYNINILDNLNIYDKVFPLTKEDLSLIEKNPYYKITLYELKNPDSKFRLVKNAIFTDPKLTQINYHLENDTLQDEGVSFKTSPFQRKDLLYEIKNGKTEVEINNFNLIEGKKYSILTDINNLREPQTLVEIYSRIDSNNLYLDFYNNPFPDIILEDQKLSSKIKIKEIIIPLDKLIDSLKIKESLDNYLANWSKALPYNLISGLRIKIGKNIIPIPSNINIQETNIGSIILNQGETDIQILKRDKESIINLNFLKLTDNPNCFSDKLKDYSLSVDYVKGFEIVSQNGSSCFLASLKEILGNNSNYIEIKLNYQSESKDFDFQYLNYKNKIKKNLFDIVKTLKKPSYLYLCIKDRNIDDCFNTHQIIDLTSGEITIPTDKKINAYDPVIFFALKNISHQWQSLILNSLIVKKFKPIFEDKLNLEIENNQFDFNVNKDQKLRLSFNLPLNYYSFYQGGKDGFNVSNGLCSQPNSYRTFRKFDDKLLSYFENCDNNVFVNLAFDSNNSYIWLVGYNLASGKFPRFNLGDGFNKYTNQILSLNQGYPDIKGFKVFQNPEFFSSQQLVLNKFNNLSLVSTNLLLPSNSTINDEKNKNFMIAHDSENEGLVVYDNFNVVQIPNTWFNLSITPEENFYRKEIINSVIKTQKILPSLWKVNLEEDSKDNILLFNEGYDRQWGIYGSFFDLLIGKTAGENFKCNNYANCFEINGSSNQFYIFYWPEKLSILGWGITLIIPFIFLKTFKGRF